MLGKADARQAGQGNRVTQEVNNLYGGETNAYDITKSIEEEGAKWNKKNYDAAFNHPNANHFWGPSFSNVLSSPEGQEAMIKATQVLKTDAMKNGVPFYEPVFQPDVTGRVQFAGFRAPNGQLFKGDAQGLNLNFWNEFKIQLDQKIRSLRAAGDLRQAAQVTGLKNDMLRSIDTQLDSDVYSKARGDAKEIFDLVGKNGEGGALQAGSAYFKNMDAYSMGEARAALKAMNPFERELFARGYASELVNRIQQMGDTEDVAKLFKSNQSRMRMRDALGADNAEKIETLLHGETVKGFLRKALMGGSDTARKLFSAENLKAGGKEAAALGVMGGGGYLTTGDYTGMITGLALRGGYKMVDRAATLKLARIMAELANSEDPRVINEVLELARKNPDFRSFARAAGQGARRSGAGAGAAAGDTHPTQIMIPGGDLPTGNDWGGGRTEPRFADGGLVNGRVPLAGAGLVEDAVKAIAGVGRSTVRHPVRKAFPGIYKEPAALLEDVRVEPEDPALKQLFGVNRDDLFEISKRKGNVTDVLGIEGKTARPSEAVENTMVPRNARRLTNSLEAARSNEGLWKGMHGWYVMDPAYQYLLKQYGPEEAKRMFTRFNTLTGMSSPGSEVVTELQRGTAANMMDNRGIWDEFKMFGGTSKNERGHNFPRELKDVDGHPYHSTSQAPAMDTFLRTGKVDMKSAKVPTYIAASTPPELGNFTDLPIADAHYTRAIGLPDTRTAEKVYDHSMTMGEYKSAAPWFRDEVANPSDLEAVPAQAILWGLYGPQTGVTTAVGAPKLELLAKGIMEAARRLGVTPEVARDLVLTGKAHAYQTGGLVSALGAAVH